MCACVNKIGETPELATTPVKEAVQGKWAYKFQAQNNPYGQNGDQMIEIITLYSGGTGEQHILNQTRNKQYKIGDVFWDVKDDAINISLPDEGISGFSYTSSPRKLVKFKGNIEYIPY